jgi:hypothetical protein
MLSISAELVYTRENNEQKTKQNFNIIIKIQILSTFFNFSLISWNNSSTSSVCTLKKKLLLQLERNYLKHFLKIGGKNHNFSLSKFKYRENAFLLAQGERK